MTFAEARGRFPVLERVAYLNAGTSGPLARHTIDAISRQLAADLAEGRSGKAYQERALELRTQLRQVLAALLNVDAALIALTASTTDGCNIVLAGLDLAPGDEIVTTTDEHFGLLGPLHASGARVVVVEPDPDRIVAAVTPRTRLLALSHVLWTTGEVLPVRELKRRTGLPILVDGAQSVCAIPVDASELDFYTVSGQKWPCGPDATGALVVADPDRLRVARPSYFTQTSHQPDGSYVPRAGAERFQPNWLPLASVVGLLAALDDLPSWRFEHAFRQAEQLRDRLSGTVEVITPAERATLVSFRPEGREPAAVVQRLAEQGVIVRDLPGRNLVRVSVGWWTSDDDLDRLAAGIAA
jgi:selenocysteine lyase/cysteine desulfurase